jgi:hypothetical protein
VCEKLRVLLDQPMKSVRYLVRQRLAHVGAISGYLGIVLTKVLRLASRASRPAVSAMCDLWATFNRQLAIRAWASLLRAYVGAHRPFKARNLSRDCCGLLSYPEPMGDTEQLAQGNPTSRGLRALFTRPPP